MKTFKRIMAMLLAVLMLCTAFGCKKPDPEPQESVEEDTGHVTLTIGIREDPLVEDFETNYLTKLIEERLDVDLNFVLLPYDQKDFNQKLELMVVAGGQDLPDIICANGSLDFATVATYGEMGMFIPLNDYLDKTPLLDASLAGMIASPITKDEYIKYCRSNDGNVYGFGNVSMTPNNSVSAGRIMVYGPWWDAYKTATGNADIVTTEDFKEFLIYVRDHDMNGNGDPSDEIPLMAHTGTVLSNLLLTCMNPFIYTQEHYLYNNNGKIEYIATKDQFKEGLKYMKDLYDEGLIDPLSFTTDKASFNSLLSSDETTVACAAAISVSALKASDPRREEYQVLGALKGPDGTRNATVKPNVPSGLNIFISKNCQNVARAIKVVDMICSDEFCMIDRYGIEGEHYIRLTGSDIGNSMYASMGFPGDIQATNSIYGTQNNIQWHNSAVIMNDGSTFTLREKDVTVEGNYNHSRPIGAGIMRELNYKNTANAVFGLLYNEEETETIQEFQTSLENYVNEMIAKFVTGAADIDAGWADYVKTVSTIGVDQYLAAVQSAFDRMNK